MSNQYSGELTALIRQLAARPVGVETNGVPGYTTKQVGRICQKLAADLELVALRITHKRAIYFASRALADAYQLPAVKPAAQKKAVAPSAEPGLSPSLEVHRRNGVKVTVSTPAPPRFQTVDLPTMRPPTTRRDGEEFRKWQRPGRW